jgi:4-amino-4-deoxychorismate lyase
MADVEAKAPLFGQTRGQRGQFRRVELLHVLAVAADEVHVPRLVDVVVGRSAVGQVGVRHQVELFEQLQRAVDGGDVHTGGLLADRVVHLLGRGMAEPAHRVEDELALRRKPQAAIAQQVGKLGHGPMIIPFVPVLAVLGRGLLPADSSFIRADDLGLTRGDGIFETIHVRGGRPWLLDAHLRRFAESARRLDLPAPDPAAVTDLAELACAQWPADQEGALKLVCTRGPEGHDEITCYMTINPVPAASIALRSTGLALVGLRLGLAAHARGDAPWLLGGAKTLSYAINMASQRYAVAHGYDDALWISSDGYALEAPTSTLVWRRGSRLLTVPHERTGILAGTTAQHALGRAGELGLTAGEEMITPDTLKETDGAWLLSSVRGVAPIRTLDAVALPTDDTTPLRALLGF